MILDTSALMVILNGEAECDAAITHLEQAEQVRISAGTLMEATIVVQARFADVGLRYLNQVLDDAACVCMPTTDSQVILVKDALKRFGKGYNNKAQLNLGDCFAYALAKETDDILLYKGNDFTHTDLRLLRL